MSYNRNFLGWKKENKHPSLSENFSSILIPNNSSFWKKLFAFSGPGLLIAVGYMDPGNWATDIAAGSQFGYTLLSVILCSNLFAIILQYLSIKLGVVAERDLAQACRDHYSKLSNIILWILCEISISACDLAEIIGSALSLNMLFNIPITFGVIITTLDIFFIIMIFQNKSFRYIEIIVAIFILTIFICFSFEIINSNPDIKSIIHGLIPTQDIITNYNILYLAIGILGATVMPHNLYLHSSIIQTRNYPRNFNGKQMAIKYATIDSILSLFLAFIINASILIVSAAMFHKIGYKNICTITDAYNFLTPLMGSSLASILFAIALFASGQNSTLTGTFAGQIIMEGFININIQPWKRRIITRLIAIIPAIIIAILYGKNGISELLVFSQIIISLQLSFAIIPLIQFTNDKNKMGYFVNGLFLKIISYISSIIIISLNIFLLYKIIFN